MLKLIGMKLKAKRGLIMEDKNELYLKNKPLPSGALPSVEKLKAAGDLPLFVIVGDLSRNGKYAESALIVTACQVVVFEDGASESFPLKSLSELRSKRMYGNAILSACVDGGERRVLFRYTYAVSSLCDGAAMFINHINDGADVKEELTLMEVLFERALSVCPKCGRTLLHPGAECIMCRSKLKIAKRLLGYMAPEKWKILFGIFLAMITTAMALIPPTITGFIVDAVFPGGSGESSVAPLNFLRDVFGRDSYKLLFAMIILLFTTYVLQYGIGIIRAYTFRRVGNRSVARLRNDIYKRAQYLPMSFYDKTSTGAVINRIASDSATLQNFMLRITQEAVVHLFQLVGIVLIMFAINPTLTLLSLIPVILIAVVTRVFRKKIRPYYRRIWRRWSAVFSTLSDTIPCIKVVKSFTGEERSSERFKEKNDDWLEMDRRLSKFTTAFPQVVSFLVTCGSLIIWGIGGSKVIDGEAGFSAGLIVSFISYASMFYNPVTFFANLSDSFQSALASTEKILDILEATPETSSENALKPERLDGRIEFKHVSFSFDRTKKVLDDVSLTIEPGDIVGIVGTTGAGKSTLVNLLMRFYEGYSGEILVDGYNIEELDLSAYRAQIGYVQQEPQMFSDTIYNNIAYSRPDATVEEVFEAADVANAHNFIARQPDGYDTLLGERGVGVSGGEKQRLSIARAVLMNPSILIFDEATAAVDSETEHLIQEAIDRLIEGRTTLMIAHRLSTLRRANKIIVVDNGRIIEFGTQDELLEKKGKYYKLVEIQSMKGEAERIKKEERLDI